MFQWEFTNIDSTGIGSWYRHSTAPLYWPNVWTPPFIKNMLHCTLLLLYSKFWFIAHYYNGNHLNYIRFQVLGVGLEMSSFATLPLSKAKHQRVSACTVTASVEIHLAKLFHLLTSFPQTLVGHAFWKKNSTTPNKTTTVK